MAGEKRIGHSIQIPSLSTYLNKEESTNLVTLPSILPSPQVQQLKVSAIIFEYFLGQPYPIELD
ncbi:CIC11C00000004145 [Sungouiella intermedia]|uniref:CIC11C00000004145 n=1 Tax=Sungouiella intermedia TaxID=45354 RepID=A0A1L0GNT0_9ASCO|nr:CIC11C00000004145 [[Candida] intermedia]